MLTHSIIVEVDENQHKNNRYICDNKRMMELFVDLGNRYEVKNLNVKLIIRLNFYTKLKI